MLEAAKPGASPERFANLISAIGYIAGTATHAGEVRPWARNVDTKVCLIIGGRVQPQNGGDNDATVAGAIRQWTEDRLRKP
jgi:hypothetical protein